MSDYYETLGIAKTASASEIKKAYRKKALKWHPDKNPNNKEEAAKKFKSIGEAYQVLSNEQERAAYDRFGKAGVDGSSGGGGVRHRHNHANFSQMQAEELFNMFFQGMNPGGGGGGGGGGMGGRGPRVVFQTHGFGPGGMMFNFGGLNSAFANQGFARQQQQPRQQQEPQPQQGGGGGISIFRLMLYFWCFNQVLPWLFPSSSA